MRFHCTVISRLSLFHSIIYCFFFINKCANLYGLLNSFGKIFKLSLFSFPISLQPFTIWLELKPRLQEALTVCGCRYMKCIHCKKICTSKFWAFYFRLFHSWTLNTSFQKNFWQKNFRHFCKRVSQLDFCPKRNYELWSNCKVTGKYCIVNVLIT